MQKVILATLCMLGFGVASFALDFPKDYKQGILYASIVRGSVIEELFIAKEVMESLRQEGKLPNGAIITMEEYQNSSGQKGAMNRIIIMQKVGDDWAFLLSPMECVPNPKTRKGAITAIGIPLWARILSLRLIKSRLMGKNNIIPFDFGVASRIFAFSDSIFNKA